MKVAQRFSRQIQADDFLTLPRMEITQALREASGEETTRIKANLGDELERALLNQGIRCYPPLRETTTGDTVRLFRAGTPLGRLIDLVAFPAGEDDAELAVILEHLR